jgi:hypothetical protein
MGGQAGSMAPVCHVESCRLQVKQQCSVCRGHCCSAHGYWVQAAKLGSLRGSTRPDASLWLCSQCSENLGLVVPPDPNRQRRVAISRPHLRVYHPEDITAESE